MSMHTESAVCTPTSRCPESTNRLARDPPSAALSRLVTTAVTCAAGAAEARRLTTVERTAAAKTTTGSADVARAKSSRARSSAMNSRINRSPSRGERHPDQQHNEALGQTLGAEVAQELSPGASQRRSNGELGRPPEVRHDGKAGRIRHGNRRQKDSRALEDGGEQSDGLTVAASQQSRPPESDRAGGSQSVAEARSGLRSPHAREPAGL